MKITGKALALREYINTYLLFPSDAILKMNVLNVRSQDYKNNLLKYGLKNLKIDKKILNESRFIIGGKGFGSGSSRQYAVEIIKTYGIKGIIAESIYPIFLRNLWNIGLFALEIKNVISEIQTGDSLIVDLEIGAITNQRNGNQYRVDVPPKIFLEIIKCENLIEFFKKSINGL